MRWSAVQHEQGERLYLPVFWSECHLNNQQMEARVSFDHPELQLVIPEGLYLLLFSAGGRGNSTLNAIPIPLLMKELHASGAPKILNVSYQVNMFTHPIRSNLAKLLKDVALILPCWLTGWETVLDRSVFAVCPRGYGQTSFRLFEALQVHTIPTYIWQELAWLPYAELIDWSEIAIVLEAKDMHKLPELSVC
jgi:Exostosin family